MDSGLTKIWHLSIVHSVIDKGMRFLAGTHVSKSCSNDEAKAFYKKCKYNKPRPKAVVPDGLEAHHSGIVRIFYSRCKHRRVKHILTSAIPRTRIITHNQLIERWHGTFRDRTNAMRGIVFHYNFFRPHESLNGHTHAEEAQIHLPFENGWGNLIRWSTVWQTLCQIDQEYT